MNLVREILVDLSLVGGVGCLAAGGRLLHPALPWLVVGLSLVALGILGVRALAVTKAEQKASRQ